MAPPKGRWHRGAKEAPAVRPLRRVTQGPGSRQSYRSDRRRSAHVEWHSRLALEIAEVCLSEPIALTRHERPAKGCILTVMDRESARVAAGVVLIVVGSIALTLTLQPYGRYFRTSNPGCSDGACGSAAAYRAQCPSLVHGVPTDRPAPVGGYGVQHASACRPEGPIREGAMIPEGICALYGLGLLATSAKRRVASPRPPPGREQGRREGPSGP